MAPAIGTPAHQHTIRQYDCHTILHQPTIGTYTLIHSALPCTTLLHMLTCPAAYSYQVPRPLPPLPHHPMDKKDEIGQTATSLL